MTAGWGADARDGTRSPLRRRQSLALLAALPWIGLGCSVPPRRVPAPAPVGARDQVVPFSASPADGRLPDGWEEYRVRRDIAPSHYFTASVDGRTVLRAQSINGSSGLRCPLQVDPLARPWVEWRWRVQGVPEGGRADTFHLDDSPARVILAFDGDIARLPQRDRLFFERVELFTGQRLPYAMLMYSWDATLPPETVAQYARSNRICTLVVDQGWQGVGEWIEHRRSLVDDFRRVFGEDPGPLVSVGVLTDADDLKQPTEADYGDIVLQSI